MLDLTAEPADADIDFIEDQLSAFNVARSTLPYDTKPLCIFVRDAAGALLGGLTGQTDRGWLYLDCFWLAEPMRRGGLGRQIIAMAEAEALRRGCRRARLFTYSFQAPDFYQGLGYTIFGVLDDYPPGHSQIWLRKDLA